MGSIDDAVLSFSYLEGGKDGATISCSCKLAEIKLTAEEIATIATQETQYVRATLLEALLADKQHEQE